MKIFSSCISVFSLDALLATPSLAQNDQFDIVRFQIEGNTLLPDVAVHAVVAPLTATKRVYGDIQKTLEALEGAYRQAGYRTVQGVRSRAGAHWWGAAPIPHRHAQAWPYNIPTVNALHGRVKGWFFHFKCVATKNLAVYLAWFRFFDNSQAGRSPQAFLRDAISLPPEVLSVPSVA